MGEEQHGADHHKENHLRIPNHILNLPGLTEGQMMLLAHIYSFGRKGCWESNETLAKSFRRSPRTISLWIGRLKERRLLFWLHPKGYYRTLWAKSHPDVQATQSLPYRGREIPKASIISGQLESTPLRNRLPSDCATGCAVTAQGDGIPLRNRLPQTKNTTKRDTPEGTEATPSPLPAGGQAPALLTDRKQEAQATILRFHQGFGQVSPRAPLSPDEFERRRQNALRGLDAREQKERG